MSFGGYVRAYLVITASHATKRKSNAQLSNTMAIIKRNVYTHVLNYIIYIHTYSHTLNLEIHHIHSHTHTHTHTHTHPPVLFMSLGSKQITLSSNPMSLILWLVRNMTEKRSIEWDTIFMAHHYRIISVRVLSEFSGMLIVKRGLL